MMITFQKSPSELGLFLQQDKQNQYNKIIYSKLYNFESCQPSHGVAVKYASHGTETYWVEGKRYDVKAGQFLLINHDHEVTTELSSSTLVEGVCLYFDPAMIANLQRSRSYTDEQLLDDPFSTSPLASITERIHLANQSPLMPFLYRHMKQLANPGPLSEQLFYHMAMALFDHEYQTIKAKKGIQAKQKTTREELYDRLLIAKEYMLDHLDEKLLIKDIAKKSMLSEFHFLRTFKQAFGCTPNQFLLQQRIESAKSLLQQSSIPIYTIAQQCGFSDRHYFSRTFRAWVGISPSRFRKNAK